MLHCHSSVGTRRATFSRLRLLNSPSQTSPFILRQLSYLWGVLSRRGPPFGASVPVRRDGYIEPISAIELIKYSGGLDSSCHSMPIANFPPLRAGRAGGGRTSAQRVVGKDVDLIASAITRGPIQCLAP